MPLMPARHTVYHIIQHGYTRQSAFLFTFAYAPRMTTISTRTIRPNGAAALYGADAARFRHAARFHATTLRLFSLRRLRWCRQDADAYAAARATLDCLMDICHVSDAFSLPRHDAASDVSARKRLLLRALMLRDDMLLRALKSAMMLRRSVIDAAIARLRALCYAVAIDGCR